MTHRSTFLISAGTGAAVLAAFEGERRFQFISRTEDHLLARLLRKKTTAGPFVSPTDRQLVKRRRDETLRFVQSPLGFCHHCSRTLACDPSSTLPVVMLKTPRSSQPLGQLLLESVAREDNGESQGWTRLTLKMVSAILDFMSPLLTSLTPLLSKEGTAGHETSITPIAVWLELGDARSLTSDDMINARRFLSELLSMDTSLSSRSKHASDFLRRRRIESVIVHGSGSVKWQCLWPLQEQQEQKQGEDESGYGSVEKNKIALYNREFVDTKKDKYDDNGDSDSATMPVSSMQSEAVHKKIEATILFLGTDDDLELLQRSSNDDNNDQSSNNVGDELGDSHGEFTKDENLPEAYRWLWRLVVERRVADTCGSEIGLESHDSSNNNDDNITSETGLLERATALTGGRSGFLRDVLQAGADMNGDCRGTLFGGVIKEDTQPSAGVGGTSGTSTCPRSRFIALKEGLLVAERSSVNMLWEALEKVVVDHKQPFDENADKRIALFRILRAIVCGDADVNPLFEATDAERESSRYGASMARDGLDVHMLLPLLCGLGVQNSGNVTCPTSEGNIEAMAEESSRKDDDEFKDRIRAIELLRCLLQEGLLEMVPRNGRRVEFSFPAPSSDEVQPRGLGSDGTSVPFGKGGLPRQFSALGSSSSAPNNQDHFVITAPPFLVAAFRKVLAAAEGIEGSKETTEDKRHSEDPWVCEADRSEGDQKWLCDGEGVLEQSGPAAGMLCSLLKRMEMRDALARLRTESRQLDKEAAACRVAWDTHRETEQQLKSLFRLRDATLPQDGRNNHDDIAQPLPTASDALLEQIQKMTPNQERVMTVELRVREKTLLQRCDAISLRRRHHVAATSTAVAALAAEQKHAGERMSLANTPFASFAARSDARGEEANVADEILATINDRTRRQREKVGVRDGSKAASGKSFIETRGNSGATTGVGGGQTSSQCKGWGALLRPGCWFRRPTSDIE